MLLFLSILLVAFLGHTPLGWFGGLFCLGAWIGSKVVA